MPRSVVLRLTDMREAIDGIASLTVGVDYQAITRNWGMQRAVERGLEIISEASRPIPDDLKASAADVPWRQIAAIGNLLRHEYQRADALLIWNIVIDHLPPLGAAVERLLPLAEPE